MVTPTVIKNCQTCTGKEPIVSELPPRSNRCTYIHYSLHYHRRKGSIVRCTLRKRRIGDAQHTLITGFGSLPIEQQHGVRGARLPRFFEKTLVALARLGLRFAWRTRSGGCYVTRDREPPSNLVTETPEHTRRTFKRV